MTVVLSAKGTRLNRRGLETREQLLKHALYCLAEGGPEAGSANAVAKRAGVTWGTIQHQFGDVDGLWAAVLEYISVHRGSMFDHLPSQAALGERVEAVVELLWSALGTPGAQAIYNLRDALPRQWEQLEESFPRTAAAMSHWNKEWLEICEQSFAGLDVDERRLALLCSLLPAAIRGVYFERPFSPVTETGEGRRGLVDAISAYLRS